MRRLIAMVAAASFAFAAASAHATSHRLTLSAVGYQTLYGHQVTIAGRVTNGRPGLRVTILARTFHMASARPVSSVVTGRGGSFRYVAHPTIQTSYVARLGDWASRTITIGVRPIVTAQELSNGEIRASVQAARPFHGRFVKLQQQQADGSWKTVVQRALGADSSVTFAPTLASSYLRVVMSVNQAGRGYLGSLSHAFLYRFYDLTLKPASLSVVYGRSVTLAGHLIDGKAGQPIDLYAKPYGQEKPVHLATTTTTAGGWWKLKVSPRILTSYHAVWSGTQRSPWVAVDVRPVITIRELANGGIRAHVQAARSFRGRLVKLQQQGSDGSWATVAQKPLDASSSILFAPGPTSRLRVVMSVNQAGKGYLGAFSPVLRYTAR